MSEKTPDPEALCEAIEQRETALNENEQRRAFLYSKVPVMLHSVDADGKLTDVNEHWLETLGYERSEVIGRDSTEFLTPDARAHAETTCVPNFRKTGFVRGEDLQFRTKSGAIRYVQLSAIAERDSDDNITRSLSVSVNVTRHRRTEKLLETAQQQIQRHRDSIRELSADVISAEENERRRLASELHDTVAQSLAMAKIVLGQTISRLEQSHLLESAAVVDGHLDRALKEIRLLIYETSPPVLNELGLGRAINWLASRVFERHGIPVFVEYDGDDVPVREIASLMLFRAVQELLTNVVKHANANKIVVSLTTDRTDLHVSVKDDGVGFDTTNRASPLDISKGFGLANIRRRINDCGGSIDIESVIGEGTRVMLSVPMLKQN